MIKREGPSPGEAIIRACNLVKTYGDFQAVRDLNLTVNRGECFGILGPNGAGKTTSIKMIYGLSPLTSGKLEVFGLAIGEHHREIKRRIGVCQQENNLDPDLNLIANLEVYASYFDIPREIAKKRIDNLLDFMSLSHRGLAKAADLSGGMMRRAVLARALINEPELVILDEPTTGLDPQSRHQVWSRLEELKAKGLTILLTTHYMEEAARLCDRLIIMDGGMIVAKGPPGELVAQHIGTDVLEVINPPEELAGYISGQGLFREQSGQRLIIYGQGGRDLYDEIRRRFPRAICVSRMATLEDVFLKLTGRELRE